MKKPDPSSGCFTAILIFVAIFPYAMAYQAIVQREFEITQGPEDGPPDRVITWRGTEAVIIGIGHLSMAFYVTLWMLYCIFIKRIARKMPWHAVSLVLLAVAVVFWIPPWQVGIRRVPSMFYALLASIFIAAAVLFHTHPERRKTRMISLIVGLAASAAAAMIIGGGDVFGVFMVGAMAAGLMYFHAARLFPWLWPKKA